MGVIDLSVAMLAKALISSGADSIHVRAGEVPELAHGLQARRLPDMPPLDPADVRRLCAALLPEAKLAEVEHGKRKRLKCHIGQLGHFNVEIGLTDGAFTLVLSPEVGQAEIEAALGGAAAIAPGRKTQPRIPVVESSAHLLADPQPVAAPAGTPEREPEPPPVDSPADDPPKRRTAILLALFLGEFGIHHFYLGRRLAGWLTLALLIASGGIAGILLGAIAFRDAFRWWRMDEDAFRCDVVR